MRFTYFIIGVLVLLFIFLLYSYRVLKKIKTARYKGVILVDKKPHYKWIQRIFIGKTI